MKKSELFRWLLDVLALNVKVSIGGILVSAILLVIALICQTEALPRGALIEAGLITVSLFFVVSCIASGFAYDYLFEYLYRRLPIIERRLMEKERKEEKNARKRKN